MASFKLLPFPVFFKAFRCAFSTAVRALSDNPSENASQQFRHISCEEVEDWESEEEDFENPERESGGSHEEDEEEVSCVCWHCGTRIKGRKFAGPFLF